MEHPGSLLDPIKSKHMNKTHQTSRGELSSDSPLRGGCGGPVVKTPNFHCGGGIGLIPGERIKILHGVTKN